MNTPTPETDAKNRELANAILPDGGTAEDGYFSMMNFACQLERERDRWQNTAIKFMDLEPERDRLLAERDQLRKVADELAGDCQRLINSGKFKGIFSKGGRVANAKHFAKESIGIYNNLPHVKAPKE